MGGGAGSAGCRWVRGREGVRQPRVVWLTEAELLRGPRALASLPSVTKPVVGRLPASPVGFSATFRQST